MTIGIIIGSVRDGQRKGELVAAWVAEQAAGRAVDYQLIDLKSFDVPVFTGETLPMMAGKSYGSTQVQAWSAAVDACDAFVFVTPEYNHGVPGGFKNAVDSLGPEWVAKAVGFVSYGADGGVRAVEQWRQVIANFQMVDVRQQVALGMFTDFGPDGLALQERRDGELGALFDQVEQLSAKLRG